ncbi:MAG: TolC family protein [Chloroflexi bacterium]|nr:TolC family protein [Chloroflexota bacterium]
MAVKHLETTKRLVKAAQKPEVEILRAKTEMAQRKDGIIQQLGVCQQVERNLKRILNKPGIGIDSPTILICDIDPAPMEYKLDANKLIDHALQHRMELLVLELQLLSSDQTISHRQNGLLPSLSLSYRYNINALGSSLGDSYDLLKRGRFVDHALGLQLEIPLGNKAAQSRLDLALLQRKLTLVTQKNREFLIKQEVIDALGNLNTNWNRLITARESTILAGRTLAAEERQYKQGLQSSINVLDAQETYAKSRHTEIERLTEYYISQIRLATAGGCLIGAANIDIE